MVDTWKEDPRFQEVSDQLSDEFDFDWRRDLNARSETIRNEDIQGAGIYSSPLR
jgi:hypothetical protein